MSEKLIKLKPEYVSFEDSKWVPLEYVNKKASIDDSILHELGTLSTGGGIDHVGYNRKDDHFRKMNLEESKGWFDSVTFEIAETANTTISGTDNQYEYLKSDLGMNIVIPKAQIVKARFRIDFKCLDSPDFPVVLDGFPNDEIEIKKLKGSIRLSLDSSFKFLPLVGEFVPNIVNVEIGPWEFNLASFRNIKIDFSGPGSRFAEWYFGNMELDNNIRVNLSIRKPITAKNLIGKAKAEIHYKTGRLKGWKIKFVTREIELV